MRLVTTMLMIGLAACSNAQNVSTSDSYSLLLMDDGQTWCGYRNSDEFKADATNLKPAESARVTYIANTLAEITYQVEAESGDWIVIDKYTPTHGGATLRRANLLEQEDLQVIQETLVHKDKADPFHLVSVSTLDGKKTKLPPHLDFPEVSISTDLSATPFVQLVGEMRNRSLGKLCRKMG